MAKIKTQFICGSCGAMYDRWQGKCVQCGEWNTLAETQVNVSKKSGARSAVSSSKPEPLGKESNNITRLVTGIGEFDRVVGFGIVPGSLVLLGGDPGIGKSTLILQVAAKIAGGLDSCLEILASAGKTKEKAGMAGGEAGMTKNKAGIVEGKERDSSARFPAKSLGMTEAGEIVKGNKVLYISGEESARQVSLRAGRLGLESDNLFILPETNVESVIEQIRKGFLGSSFQEVARNDKQKKPSLVIVDSIQTMYSEDIVSASGSVGQVSLCAQKLMNLAKSEHIAIVLIGHVTKEGSLAGPRLLEHLVDVVLYLEGDRYGGFRILRGIKNRFGSTNETGIFEMTKNGMAEVKNPSQTLLSERLDGASGVAIFATMEGTRPLLVEIQALTSVTSFGYPKRTASGMDLNRLNLLLAVLTKRTGLNLANQDVFVNIVGGMAIREPALDLAVALAIASAYKNKSIKKDMAVFGEIGLAGEVRNVDNVDERLKEIEKLGFKSVLVPNASKISETKSRKIKLIRVSNLKEAISSALT